MKRFASPRTLGSIIAALVFVFTITVTAQAAVKTTSLKNMLRKSGIAMKLVRLDRTDGFFFGLSFKGKKIPAITIAPGLNGMFLVTVNGNEMIYQKDDNGGMQVIQAEGDISYVLCILNAIVDFMGGMQTCVQSDPACMFTQIIALITNIMSCNTPVPTE